MADYLVTDTDLTSIANAIRTKGSTSAQLTFPQGFVDAVGAIPTGGITPTGTKQITLTDNGTITEDVTNYASAQITVAIPVYNGDVIVPETQEIVVNGKTFKRMVDSPSGERSNWYDIEIQYADWPSYGYAYKCTYAIPSGTTFLTWAVGVIRVNSDFAVLDEFQDGNLATYIFQDLNTGWTYAEITAVEDNQ